MNNKYLILLLFIFLVFLMGSINSTVTNNFYNNTTGSQDHAILSNLSYADSNHIGFQASDTLNDDVEALGYIKNVTGNFLNLTTGGTVAGNIRINNTMNTGFIRNNTGFDMNAGGYNISLSALNDTYCQYQYTILNGYYDSGRVEWNKYNTNEDTFITGLRNCYNAYRNETWAKPNFVGYSSTPSTNPFTNFNLVFDFGSDYINLYENVTISANLTVSSLAGTGNAYVCVDSAGKQYRGTPTC